MALLCEEQKLNDDGPYKETQDPCYFYPNIEVYPKDFDDDDESFRSHYKMSARVMEAMMEDETSDHRKPLNLC